MAETQALVPKARKILNIRRAWRTERSHFLQLPRELRDIIYELLMIEPTLWDKRHQPGCPLHSLDRPFERPVSKTNRQHIERDKHNMRELLTWRRRTLEFPYGQGLLTLEQVRTCYRVCRRRKGFGLRQVNRQIRNETEKLFWSTNTFCYTYEKDFLHDFRGSCEWCRDCSPMLGTVTPIPIFIRNKVQRLSFVEHRHCGEIPYYREGTMDNVVTALEGLPNLRYVELPAHVLRVAMNQFSTVCLPLLTTIRASAFQHIVLGDRTPLDLYFSTTFHPRKCQCRTNQSIRAQRPESNMKWCYQCWDELDDERRGLKDFLNVSVRFGPASGHVQEYSSIARDTLTRDGVPGHPQNGTPYVMTLQAGQGKVEMVQVHGLPCLDEDTRRRRLLAQRMAERKLGIQQKAVRTQRLGEIAAPEDSLDGLSLQPTKAEAREHVRALTENEATDAQLEQRRKRNENRDASEAHRQKAAVRKERNKLRMGKEEMEREKRAGRKRCSR